jgi:REP-associated tyrosine transposase
VAACCGEFIGAKASEHGWRIVALEIESDLVNLFVKAHRSDSPSRSTARSRVHIAATFGWIPTCGSVCHLVVPVVSAAAAGAMATDTVRRYIGTQNGRGEK